MADGAGFGFGHSRILLCNAACVVVFQPRGLWPTPVSLKRIAHFALVRHDEGALKCPLLRAKQTLQNRPNQFARF
jgi:hypothetical protein